MLVGVLQPKISDCKAEFAGRKVIKADKDVRGHIGVAIRTTDKGNVRGTRSPSSCKPWIVWQLPDNEWIGVYKADAPVDEDFMATA